MAYIQIDNPEIIDLASIQKIINVVNDHSDYLNVLVNKFGADYLPDWLAANNQANFDIATTNIVHGQETVTPDDDAEGSGGVTYYSKAIDFETGVSFSQKPRVFVSHDNSDGVVGGQLDLIVSTHNISANGFTIRVFRPGDNQEITNNVVVNYIAIGPR